MHQYINEMKEHEFVLWVIGANAKDKGKFVYELPKNVVEVHEVFLDDALQLKDSGKMLHAFTEEETNSLKELMLCRRPNWEILFRLYHDQKLNPMSFLRSEEFLNILTECCIKDYPYTPFADAFHTMRSMLLPVLYLMGSEVPKADVYHAICTGYGGLLACLGGYVYKKKVLLTEHGIYTREREEEIIRAKWVQPAFKKQWISFFYMLSDIIYTRAFLVSALFTNAMHAQIQMGCDKEKCRVVENGINYERLSPIPLKEEDGWVDIGAIVRLAPIKDIKTMIYAFYELCTTREHVRLHIMGGVDDEEYAQECYALVDQLHLENVIFTGRVDIISYMEKLLTFCADNGVVEENVTQSGQEVTATVAENFLQEKATAAILCRGAHADLFPIDIGMARDTKVPRYKVAYGTKNMAKGPAMTREEAVRALETGIAVAEEKIAAGYQLMATGEMGIGNTTTSSAMAAVFLNQPVPELTGRGAGLSSEGLARKIAAIEKAIAINQPDPSDPIDVLAKVGGFDIAGMAGVFLAGAAHGVPVVMDGFISCVAALLAARIAPFAKDYMIASHVSKEPAAHLLLAELGKEAFLHCDMCLGEGTGAIMLFPILDQANAVYRGMATFDEAQIETYVPLT